MPLQPGDEVSLTLNAPIQLSRYVTIKPFAHVRRTMGDDPEADITAMRTELRRLFFDQLAIELGLMDSVAEALSDDATLVDLQDWCAKEMGNVDERTTQKVRRSRPAQGEEEGADQAPKGPTRRSATKRKPRRRTRA